MSCPPCNHQCREGRDCPARATRAKRDRVTLAIVLALALTVLLIHLATKGA